MMKKKIYRVIESFGVVKFILNNIIYTYFIAVSTNI